MLIVSLVEYICLTMILYCVTITYCYSLFCIVDKKIYLMYKLFIYVKNIVL